MASIKFEIDGLRELNNALKLLDDKMQKSISRKAVTAGAKVIRAAARANAPVKTGKLKKSIQSLRDKRESRKGLEVRAVSVFRVPGVHENTPANVRAGKVGKKYMKDPPTFYWKFNELGTVKQAAKPFLVPALLQNISRVENALKDKLLTELEKAVAQLPKGPIR